MTREDTIARLEQARALIVRNSNHPPHCCGSPCATDADEHDPCCEWAALTAAIRLLRAPEWQPISTAPENKRLLLYFPAMERHRLGELIVVDTHPVHYPRKPTLWAPIPTPPNTTGDARR